MGMRLVKWLRMFRLMEKGEIKELALGPRVRENSDNGIKLKASIKRKALNLSYGRKYRYQMCVCVTKY